MFGAPQLTSDEVVAQSVQTAGDVGQTHSYLYKQANPGYVAAVLNHSLVYLELCEGSHIEDRETSVEHPAYTYEKTRDNPGL